MTPDTRSYQSLTVQVAQRIASEIQRERWVGALPGERSLAETLQVSRKTLRKALGILQHEGLIMTIHGSGHRIVANGPGSLRPSQDPTVGLLSPESIDHLRPFTALWVDALRSLLIEHGLRLTMFSGQRFFSGRPEKALQRLVGQNPQGCWILAHSSERIQQWFSSNGVPCVLAGSSHPGLELPNVDLDYFAICRHAVGAMLRHGHRRIAFVTRLSQRAGDLESEAGFSAGARQPSYTDVSPQTVHHDGTVTGVNRMLARLFDFGASPTAILVANPAYYLTAITYLAGRGMRVPDDVSLVSRDDDSFLSYLNPTPARYSCSPGIFAKRLLQFLLVQIRGEPPGQVSLRIEAKFVPGNSLGRLKDSSGGSDQRRFGR